jgi:hypothetical protein
MQKPLRSVDIFSQITHHRSPTPINIRRLRRVAIARRRKHSIFVFLISLLTATWFIGCKSNHGAQPNQPSSATKNKALTAVSDTELAQQIEVFSTDLGDLGAAAWSQLQSYPRAELIDRLTQMRDNSSPDDIVRPNIAFVFCNLDQDYGPNRDAIVAAFNQSPDTADLYEVLLDRLIQRGDKDLLQVLFEMATRSDGALSEGLAATFSEQTKTNTEAFLVQLSKQPRSIRSQIGEFVNSATSDEDKGSIKTFLKSIPATSPLFNLAKELEGDLSKID